MLHYKKDAAVGIREKFGEKRQVFSYGRTAKSTEVALRAIADAVLAKLDKGVTVANAKLFADREVAKLDDVD